VRDRVKGGRRGVKKKARKRVWEMCVGREGEREREREREGGGEEIAAGIKQVFEKGKQREKVSAKYLKEC